jgi:sec-independent protein translocase protein TatC
MPPLNSRHQEFEPPEDDLATMGFLDHLDELRSRLIKSCLAIAGGMLISCFFVTRIADIVLSPMLSSLPTGTPLIYTRPGEGFAFYLDLSLMGGIVLAVPFVTYQVWRFIAPGLYVKEKRLVVPFLLLAIAGTISGALFSHDLLFPSMMAFFGNFDSPRMRFMPRIEDTFALYKNTLIGMVVVFQIPTLVFVLARVGAVTARFLWRHLNYAVLIAVIAGALLTPSADPWNQLVFAAPMVAMYLLGIALAWIVHPGPSHATGHAGTALRLVFAAGVIEQSRRLRSGRSRSQPHLVLTRGGRTFSTDRLTTASRGHIRSVATSRSERTV